MSSVASCLVCRIREHKSESNRGTLRGSACEEQRGKNRGQRKGTAKLLPCIAPAAFDGDSADPRRELQDYLW
jgi:hypothetical protein